MKPTPIDPSTSFESLLGTVKAGFPSQADERVERLSGCIDAINRTIGQGSILFGVQGDVGSI